VQLVLSHSSEKSIRKLLDLDHDLDQHRNLNSLLLVRRPSPGKELELPAKFAELPLFLSGKNFSAKFLLLHCDVDHRQNVII